MTALAQRTLVVLSGGLDSATLASKLHGEGMDLAAIHFDIGYRPRVAERNSARLLAHRLGLPLEIVDLAGLFNMVTGFYPTEFVGSGELDKGQVQPFKLQSEIDHYVVGFQVILAVAVYYAQLAGISKVATALLKEQYDFNPGLGNFSDQFMAALQPLNPTRIVTIINPFRDKTKADIVAEGARLHVSFGDTWSCMDGGSLHCGHCNGCVARRQAFTNAAIADPTRYLAP